VLVLAIKPPLRRRGPLPIASFSAARACKPYAPAVFYAAFSLLSNLNVKLKPFSPLSVERWRIEPMREQRKGEF
jgi:hypothetical protein